MDRVAAMAAEVGRRSTTPTPPTCASSRSIDPHLALDLGGPELQRALVEALIADFTRFALMGDRDVLREAALDTGLPADRVDAGRASGEYAEQVSTTSSRPWRRHLGQAVLRLLDRRLGVSGAQPQQAFAEALWQAHDAAAEQAPARPGDHCGSPWDHCGTNAVRIGRAPRDRGPRRASPGHSVVRSHPSVHRFHRGAAQGRLHSTDRASRSR